MQINGLPDWTAKLGRTDTPLLNLIAKQKRATRPIIGQTEDKRPFILKTVNLLAWKVERRFARFEPVDCDEECNIYVQHFTRKNWKWRVRLNDRLWDLAPKPIYDPDWIDPNPPIPKVTWGWAAPDE